MKFWAIVRIACQIEIFNQKLNYKIKVKFVSNWPIRCQNENSSL